MAVQVSYPGVYIEEIASAVRTIVGVPTSIAAFVGTAPRGPDSTAVPIGSLLQYEQTFGRADGSPLGIAVQLFFQNGGAQALVVRIVGRTEEAATLTLSGGDGNAALTLEAASKGLWGRELEARVDHDTGADGRTTYNLTLREAGARTEIYRQLSSDPTAPRWAKRLLKASALVVVKGEPGRVAPSDTLPAAGAAAAEPAEGGGGRGRAAAAGDAAAAPPPEPIFVSFTLPDAAEAAPVPDADDYLPPDGDGGAKSLMQHDAFFNILVAVPPGSADLPPALLAKLAKLAADKRAFMVVDPPSDWTDTSAAMKGRDAFFAIFDEVSRRNAACYFPRLKLGDLSAGASPQIVAESFPPAGAVAGLYARTDTDRGLWKAPAGIATSIGGTIGLTDVLADFDSGQLNPVAVNALRTMPIVGHVAWGARTMVGADLEASQWKYIPVRRLALYIEESLYRGTQWVVFEPNDEPLWAQVRLNVGTFMHTLFRQGAFQGTTAAEAYFVKCDRDSNPQADVDRGIVNVIVGFAPLKPAEFVVIQLQQISSGLEV